MSLNKKTTISAFAAEMAKVSTELSKAAIIKKHVVTHYAPIREKINVLKVMNEKAVATGKHGQYIDLTVSKLNFVMAILVLYTDLVPDQKANGESLSWDAYDTLKKTGAYSLLLNEIGKDLDELLTVQEQIIGTWNQENTSTAAYVNKLVENVSMIFSTALGKELESLKDNMSSDELKELLGNMLSRNM